MSSYSTRTIMGISIAAVPLSHIASLIASFIESPGKKTIFGVNAYSFNIAYGDHEYRRILEKATFVYPEGYGTYLASKILRQPLIAKTTLMDFIYELLALAQTKRWSIYLLGGKKDVLKNASDKLKERYPTLQILGYHHGYFSKRDEEVIINRINRLRPKIVLVAMGSPKQEKWIAKNINKLDAKAFLGIGGSIDIIAGAVSRAPKWMHENGLEWVFRLVQEPERLWKRYLIGNIIFLYRIFLACLHNKRMRLKY